MITASTVRFLFLRQLAIFVLASAGGLLALAQAAQPTGSPQTVSSPAPATTDVRPAAPASTVNTPAKEGFWGRINPFAGKNWVRKQTTPISDRLSELDEVNARNSREIQDVDGRAQAGIRRAQSSADAANETAMGASTQAEKANGTAQGASGHVDRLKDTVNGLDQYRQVTETELKFSNGQPILSTAARKQLDELADRVSGRQGYILELEAHSPGAGSVGIQNSERLAEAVKRYLVTEHEIPVYRLHAVALGNARSQANEDGPHVRTSSVHIRLMENSLAAQGAPPPQGMASSTGAERP